MRKLNLNSLNRANNKGFTLVELVVTIVVIGLLAALLVPKFIGPADKAKTQEKWIAAEQLAQCIGVYNITLGLASNDPTNVPNFLQSGNTMLDVIMDGDVAVVAAADSRFNAESLKCDGMKKLVDTVTAATSGTPGNYTISGSRVTVANGSARELDVIYATVPTSEVRSMAYDYGNADSFDGTSTGNAGSIRWTAAVDGLHTLTVRLPKI